MNVNSRQGRSSTVTVDYAIERRGRSMSYLILARLQGPRGVVGYLVDLDIDRVTIERVHGE
jgi:hypothetical protein